jgi:hypothetical protein
LFAGSVGLFTVLFQFAPDWHEAFAQTGSAVSSRAQHRKASSVRVAAISDAVPSDVPSGFQPALIDYFAGNGNNQTEVTNGSIPTNVSVAGQPVADSHGNVYIAGGGAFYIIYGGSYIPKALANVTTNAATPVTPQTGLIYVIGGLGPFPCGACEGLPLDQVNIASITNLAIDSQDNLYYADSEGPQFVGDVVRKVDAATSNVTTLAGQWGVNNSSFGTSIGDGGPATSAILYQPSDVKLDSFGNLFIDDYLNDEVRVVYMGSQPPPILAAEGIAVGPSQIGYIYNVAGQAAYYCSTVGACGDGGLATAAGLGNEESMAVDAAGNVYIADSMTDPNTGNPSGYPYIRLVYAGGKVPTLLNLYLNPSGGSSVPPQDGYIYPVTGYGSSTQFAACSSPGCGDGGLPANVEFSANIIPYVTLNDVNNSGSLYIVDTGADAVRKIDTSGYASTIAGTNDPTGAATCGTIPGPSVGACLGEPNGMSIDAENEMYISGGAGGYIWKVAHLSPQTIDFPAFNPASVTYGATPITLAATASSGLPVQFAVTSTPAGIAQVSGSQLIIKGAGSITVTASQPGNSAYAPATPVTQTLTVKGAPLTVTADAASKVFGAPNPAFTATITGFVNGDTDTTPGAYSGAPAFTTAATTTSPQGTYSITPSIGTLTSSNYVFIDFVSGTLTVTGSAPQTINFPAFSPSTVTYGQTPITLSATASSGGPVAFACVSGPCMLSGANGSTLTITGGGSIVVQATQDGYLQYKAATPVSRTLIVKTAELTVTGPTVTIPYGTTINPTSFPAAVVTGFVGSDTQSSTITGSAQYSTVTGTPNAGKYPIGVGLGTLALLPAAVANYTFATPVNGSLTVNPAAQSISFNPVPSGQIYGNQVQLAAVATSGLPVAYSTTGPAAQKFAGVLSLVGIGAVTVTATQPGNGNYLSASPVTQTIPVGQAPLNITVTNAYIEQGAPLPTFTYTVGCTLPEAGCFVLSDTDIPSVITGVPNLTTTAVQNSSPGTYPIVASQGTLAAPNYYFVFINGTLTVAPPGIFAIAANPGTLTIARGQSGQTTLTITPSNYYQGTVTLACGQLPANVSCVVSPATYNFPGSQNANGQENPAQGTVTINTAAGAIVGALRPANMDASLAKILFPGAIASILLLFARRRAEKRLALFRCAIFVALGFGLLSLASCSKSSGLATAAPGTVTVTINGSGTTVSGTGSVTASAPLTVVIQ